MTMRQPFWVLVRGGGSEEPWIMIAAYLNRDQATDRMAEEVLTGPWEEVAVVERVLTCVVAGDATASQPATPAESAPEE